MQTNTCRALVRCTVCVLSKGTNHYFIGAGVVIMEAELLLWCSSCVSSWHLFKAVHCKAPWRDIEKNYHNVSKEATS